MTHAYPIKNAILFAMAILILQSCVSQKKYDKLSKETIRLASALDRTQRELRDTRDARSEIEDQLRLRTEEYNNAQKRVEVAQKREAEVTEQLAKQAKLIATLTEDVDELSDSMDSLKTISTRVVVSSDTFGDSFRPATATQSVRPKRTKYRKRRRR